MKNKKVVIIISSIVLIISAIIFGIHKFYSSYMFNMDGTISGANEAYELYYEQLEKVSGDDRINLINFGVEQNIITREEAEELFKSK